MTTRIKTLLYAIFCFKISFVFVACQGPSKEAVVTEDGRVLEPIILQTDWYAQPEHGGFYEAMLTGI